MQKEERRIAERMEEIKREEGRLKGKERQRNEGIEGKGELQKEERRIAERMEESRRKNSLEGNR